MNNKVQNVLLGVLAVGLVGITVAYAALTQQLKIEGTATVKASTWDIHFNNMSNGAATGYATLPEAGKLAIENGNTTTISGNIGTLKAPGDSITYTFDIVNAGDINASITNVTTPTLTCKIGENPETTVCNNLEYSIKYSDGNAISVGDDLAKGATKPVTLTITSKNTDVIASQDVTVTASPMTITYGQK